MEDNSRKDIRALLKTFGVKADEVIVGFLAKNPKVDRLKLKITLVDETDYRANAPSERVHLEVKGEVIR